MPTALSCTHTELKHSDEMVATSPWCRNADSLHATPGTHSSHSQAVCLAAEALASSTPASQSLAPARTGQETTLDVTWLAG